MADQRLSFEMPVAESDMTSQTYTIWPFGVHGGGHAQDGHPGWDLEIKVGATLLAAADGSVERIVPDGHFKDRYAVWLMHPAGAQNYITTYGNLATLAPGLVVGARVVTGQSLGTVGEIGPNFAYTHFQLADPSGIVSPEAYLSPAARQIFDRLWARSSYVGELCEPFPSNPRDITFPRTRVWRLQSGNLAIELDFTRPSQDSNDYEYVLRDSAGGMVETGTVRFRPGVPLSQIDLWPSHQTVPRKGVCDIISGTLRIALGTPGGEAPQDLSQASEYATMLESSFEPAATRVVPIVLDVAAPSGHYTTELCLTNRAVAAADLSLRYTAALGNRAGSGLVTERLAPGEQKIIPDALEYLRAKGLAISGAADEPFQGGTLVVTSSARAAVEVTARTTTATSPPQAVGAAGLAYAALPGLEGFSDTAHIYGLRTNEQDRSNVAVVNLEPTPVTVKVTAYSGSGDGLHVVVREAETLAGYGWVQYSGILSQAGFSNGWVKVERVSSSGLFSAYGVINDNQTSDGSFVLPVTGVPGSRLTIPVIVETPAFSSELVLTNPTAGTTSFLLTYRESLSSELGAGGMVEVRLGPQEQRIVPNAVDFLRRQGAAIGGFGLTSYAGAVQVETGLVNSWEVFAGARTSARAASGGQFGLFTPGRYSGQQRIEEGMLFGLRADDANRSNVALVNAGYFGEGPVGLTVQVYDGDRAGTAAGAPETLTLEPGEWRQLTELLKLKRVSNGWVRISRQSGYGPWFAYGVINDGSAPGLRTGDGAFVPMQVTKWLQ